jgi:hypothetical protein
LATYKETVKDKLSPRSKETKGNSLQDQSRKGRVGVVSSVVKQDILQQTVTVTRTAVHTEVGVIRFRNREGSSEAEVAAQDGQLIQLTHERPAAQEKAKDVKGKNPQNLITCKPTAGTFRRG